MKLRFHHESLIMWIILTHYDMDEDDWCFNVSSVQVPTASVLILTMSARVKKLQARMPAGFQTVLESLSKAVLINRPINIYKFAADYLEAELDRRIIQELSMQGE